MAKTVYCTFIGQFSVPGEVHERLFGLEVGRTKDGFSRSLDFEFDLVTVSVR